MQSYRFSRLNASLIIWTIWGYWQLFNQLKMLLVLSSWFLFVLFSCIIYVVFFHTSSIANWVKKQNNLQHITEISDPLCTVPWQCHLQIRLTHSTGVPTGDSSSTQSDSVVMSFCSPWLQLECLSFWVQHKQCQYTLFKQVSVQRCFSTSPV